MTDTSVDDGQLYINGKFTEASGGRRFEVTDPSTGAVVGTLADADPADVELAVTAARAAFDEGPWPKMSGRERARILHKAADLVRASAGSGSRSTSPTG
jgi:phenylacetaldehyde dehydrogenase